MTSVRDWLCKKAEDLHTETPQFCTDGKLKTLESKGRSGTQKRVDTRSGEGGPKSEGSGEWGALKDERRFADYENYLSWKAVAHASAPFKPNSARHMRHYLDNTGTPLTVDVDAMLKANSGFRAESAMTRDGLREQIDAKARTGARSFTLSSARQGSYSDANSDWFYAVGGFNFVEKAEVEVNGKHLTVRFTTHVTDRYNWDDGKKVAPFGLSISDRMIGRLHKVGLAREYDISGTSSAETVSWDY